MRFRRCAPSLLHSGGSFAWRLICVAAAQLGAYVTNMTWAEICEDKTLAALPYRIESDRWGNIVSGPLPRSRHGEYQGEIALLLRQKLSGGLSIPECPLQTEEGVKAADVAWVSRERRASRHNDPVQAGIASRMRKGPVS